MKCGCLIYFFPQFPKSDMSRYRYPKYFRESLGLQDIESWLYIDKKCPGQPHVHVCFSCLPYNWRASFSRYASNADKISSKSFKMLFLHVSFICWNLQRLLGKFYKNSFVDLHISSIEIFFSIGRKNSFVWLCMALFPQSTLSVNDNLVLFFLILS